MEETIIDLVKPPSGSIQEASFYVCFSRLTDIKNLLILRPWYSDDGVHNNTWQHVKKHLTSARNIDFLKEMDRLTDIDNKTLRVYGNTITFVFNTFI